MLENVVEEQVEIADEEQKSNDNYIEQKNLAYAECSHQLWKYYSCGQVISQLPKLLMGKLCHNEIVIEFISCLCRSI